MSCQSIYISQLNIGLYKAIQHHCITPTKKDRLILCRTVCFCGCRGYYAERGGIQTLSSVMRNESYRFVGDSV